LRCINPILGGAVLMKKLLVSPGSGPHIDGPLHISGGLK
jgi:hypothetical protein